MKLAPEPPKGDKMEKDGGSGGGCEPHGQWWEVVGVVGAVGAARAMMGGGVGGRGSGGSGGSGGRAWEIAPEPPKGDKLQVEGEVIGKR